jgi:hypothetical protein
VDGLDCNTSYYFQVRARGDGSPYSYTYGNPSSSVEPGTKYIYRVHAVNAAGLSEVSRVTVTTRTVP